MRPFLQSIQPGALRSDGCLGMDPIHQNPSARLGHPDEGWLTL
jgi:hypothetical protein